jgi:hypothetical protein
MSGELNTGQGRCQGTARLLISPVRAVIELGASGDVLATTLKAVHHANRHGSTEDFIAVALPMMRMGRNCMLPGHEVELIGSERCLSAFLALDGLTSLMRRGMLKPAEIDEAFLEPGETGAAYVRDRACEKHTAGWLRRNKARAKRRGKPWQEKRAKLKANDLSVLALHYGESVLHVRQMIAEMSDAPLMVSTYGFSSPTAGGQAVLPVLPDAAREAHDAA